MAGRLWLCFIVINILVIYSQTTYAESDCSALYNQLEEAYLKEIVSSKTNYFVPVPVQTSGGGPVTFKPLSNELIVLYDFEKAGLSPENIVDAVNSTKPSPSLTSQLGDPTQARFLIPMRLSIADLEMISQTNPRAMLQDYIVLKYPSIMSQEGINNLVKYLAEDPLIRWVEINDYLDWSVNPIDPFFLGTANPPTPPSHQWGMQTLNLPAAWDYIKGFAYIAALDNGIQMTHPDLQNNFRPQFSRDVSSCASPPCNDTNIDELKHGGSTAGHGTHVAGIIAATSNDPNNNIGVAGTCWNCSFMMGKVSDGSLVLKDATLAGVNWLVGTGTQAINMSYNDYYNSLDCGTQPLNTWCQAINLAEEYDVVLVNSSGNGDGCQNQSSATCTALSDVRPPGSDDRVLSIGAYDPYTSSRASFSDYGSRLDLVAPGVDILSTFYSGKIWKASWNCQDIYGGYGTCTGTSMAAPHITGLVGLLRSVNPLLPKANIKDILTYNASGGGTRTNNLGYGIPDAEKSVKAILGTVGGRQLTNRLTPLFSLYSTAAQDHYYTTVPQMALASQHGTLQPQPPAPYSPVSYQYIGIPTPGYVGLDPCEFSPCPPPPSASVYIFTTENSPITGTLPLVPLYRLSYQGNFTGNNPRHVDHAYTTEQAGINYLKNRGYNLDGIEGYIYNRNTTPQPPGTVRLFRKESLLTGDHAIFPETELAQYDPGEWVNDGNEWIGYVYPNVDSDGDTLIDGFEQLAGTCVGVADTNGDGISDGAAVMNYSNSTHSYGNPGLCHYIVSSPTLQDFGNVTVGSSSASYVFTISHGGLAVEPNLVIGTVSSTNPSEFGITADNCSGNTVLPAGSCTVSVTFTPGSLGVKSGSLTVPSNDPAMPLLTIALSGTGVNPPPPVANFSCTPLSGTVPLYITCTDSSSNNPTSWSWDFGDGQSGSTAQNGTHTYRTSGTFNVTLTATNAGGSSQPMTRTGYITVSSCNDGLNPVRLVDSSNNIYGTYTSVSSAYTAVNGGYTIIKSKALVIPESQSVILNGGTNVTLQGGYSCGFSSIGGETVLINSLEIDSGQINISNYSLQ